MSAQQLSLVGEDWLAIAWERLRNGRPRYAAISLDRALEQPVIGRVLRAYAAQLQRDATRDDIKAARNRLAGKHHPDKGGNAALMAEINVAYEKALAQL